MKVVTSLSLDFEDVEAVADKYAQSTGGVGGPEVGGHG